MGIFECSVVVVEGEALTESGSVAGGEEVVRSVEVME